MLPVALAQQQILDAVTVRTERVPVASANHRFASADVLATAELPAWDNSAMDGFAVRAADLPGTLPVVGTIAAGDPPGAALAPGTTLRIMTGAPVPQGADTVVMRENVTDHGAQAQFETCEEPGRHIRRRGEDVALQDLVVRRGHALTAADLALLTALGETEIQVGRAPRVALIATGTELVNPGKPLAPGQKYNSNAVALRAMVADAGGIVVRDVIAGDDRESVTAALRASLQHDVVISCGGVSVGDFDFVKDCLEPAGIERVFWKVAVKPGKPVVFGRGPGDCLFFGLPGNPASTSACFELFVRPALLSTQGATRAFRPRISARLAHDYSKSAGRAHYLRATLEQQNETWMANASRSQSSGNISTMTSTDALVEVPADTTQLYSGDLVSAIVLKLP